MHAGVRRWWLLLSQSEEFAFRAGAVREIKAQGAERESVSRAARREQRGIASKEAQGRPIDQSISKTVEVRRSRRRIRRRRRCCVSVVAVVVTERPSLTEKMQERANWGCAHRLSLRGRCARSMRETPRRTRVELLTRRRLTRKLTRLTEKPGNLHNWLKETRKLTRPVQTSIIQTGAARAIILTTRERPRPPPIESFVGLDVGVSVRVFVAKVEYPKGAGALWDIGIQEKHRVGPLGGTECELIYSSAINSPPAARMRRLPAFSVKENMLEHSSMRYRP